MTQSPTRSARRIAAGIACAVAVLAAAWIPVLWIAGGFDTFVYGVRLRSNDPSKPGLLVLIALTCFVWLRGIGRVRSDLGVAMTRAQVVWSQLRRYATNGLIVGVLALCVFVIAVMKFAPVAGGSDSYGYLSQVDLWLKGHPFVEQPWVEGAPWPDADFTFSPLAYLPVPSRHAIAPTAAPGLALVMGVAKEVGGYRAMFLIGPLSAAVLVLATFGLGRRLGSSTMGLAAAWLVATSPNTNFQMLVPLTDAPAAAGWTLACYLLFGSGVWTALGAGLVAGIATLIRPNLVPTAAVMGGWLVYKAWQDRAKRARAVRRCLGFAAGLVPGLAAVAGTFWWLFGSPVHTGYGSLDSLYSGARILPGFLRQLSWLAQSQTPVAFLGLTALAWPVRRLWPEAGDRSMIVALGLIVLTLWGQYAAYQAFASWENLRYVLASWPAIMLGVAAVALLVSRWGGRFAGPPVVAAVIVLGVWTVQFTASRGIFDIRRGESKFPAVAQLVRDRTDESTVIIAGLHTGSLRYYGGRITMRTDLDPAWLDRSIAWLSDHGIHTYALLEGDEVPQFTRRFAGQQHADLSGRLVFLYEGPAKIYFYDLSRPANQRLSPHLIAEEQSGPTYVKPVPPPTLVWK